MTAATVSQEFLDRLIAQPVQEQAARRAKVERAISMLDDALVFALDGMALHACARTGQARDVARELGII